MAVQILNGGEMNLEVQEFDIRAEMNIAIGMIVSTEFIQEIKGTYQKGYLKVPYLDFLINICLDYFDKYGKAPGSQIQSLFEQQKRKLRNEEFIKSIEDFFVTIEEFYFEMSSDSSFNVDYYLDSSKEYFQKRIIELSAKELLFLTESNRLREAQKLIDDCSTKVNTSLAINSPNQISIEGIERILRQADDSDRLFSFRPRISSYDNKLEYLMGAFKRGHLVSFMGPVKSGKSFLLMETGFQAVESGMKILFVSLEMSNKDVEDRILARLTGMNREENEIAQPSFDCLNNQTDTCKLPFRQNDIPLFRGNTANILAGGVGQINKLLKLIATSKDTKPDPDYRRCDYCRTRRRTARNFKFGMSFNTYTTPAWNDDIILRQTRAFTGSYGNGFFYICYPCYTTSVKEVVEEINKMELTHGYLPDVVIIDYADLMEPSTRVDTVRNQLNEIWQTLKGLAQKKNICVVTATQTNRQGIEKDTFSTANLAEDIRKAGTVDSLIGIQQTETERENGLVRLNCLLHRHQRFSQNRFLVCCQNLALTQPLLDVEWLPF